MTLVVLLGGARSGKSRLAVALAGRAEPVTFLATGEAGDEEMRSRIDAHRAERPPGWRTVEEPLELAAAIGRVEPRRTLVVDCLSLWVANLLGRGDAETAVLELGAGAAAAAAARPGLTIVVSNEVGLGVVPATPLGRVYRDLLGGVNRAFVEAADEAAFVVAGRPLRLAPPDDFLVTVCLEAGSMPARPAADG
jgi:adenosyl cobinamide kinase/adenosyl cobinamide phosphate guanylyltransferase